MAKAKRSLVATASEIANHQFDSSSYLSLGSLAGLRDRAAKVAIYSKTIKAAPKAKAKK